MRTFRIISMNTGAVAGKITGTDYWDAEQGALNLGFDMYDEYMLVDIKIHNY